MGTHFTSFSCLPLSFSIHYPLSFSMFLPPIITLGLFILVARWRSQVFWGLAEELGRVKSHLEEVSFLAEFCLQEENVVWGKLQVSRDEEATEKEKLRLLQAERKDLLRRKILLSNQRHNNLKQNELQDT